MGISAEWQQVAVYAAGAALLIVLLQRISILGRVVRFALSFGLLAFCLFLLLQHAPFEPHLARLAASLGLDRQEVTGREVRIPMAPDGHFWATATLNGSKRRMLIDSGATVTAISDATAAAASVDRDAAVVPVMLRTASGFAPAYPATVRELRVGNVVARGLKVVISPGLGNLDVLGMNLLSKLQSWRVEGRTLILVPHHPQADQPARPAAA